MRKYCRTSFGLVGMPLVNAYITYRHGKASQTSNRCTSTHTKVMRAMQIALELLPLKATCWWVEALVDTSIVSSTVRSQTHTRWRVVAARHTLMAPVTQKLETANYPRSVVCTGVRCSRCLDRAGRRGRLRFTVCSALRRGHVRVHTTARALQKKVYLCQKVRQQDQQTQYPVARFGMIFGAPVKGYPPGLKTIRLRALSGSFA